jgi:hypothetical protein
VVLSSYGNAKANHGTTRDSSHILLSGFSGMRHRVCVHIRVQFQGQSSLHVFKSGDAGGRGRSSQVFVVSQCGDEDLNFPYTCDPKHTFVKTIAL